MQFKIILTQTKTHHKDDYNLDDDKCGFQSYYYDKLHSTIKVFPYRAIMNANEAGLMGI